MAPGVLIAVAMEAIPVPGIGLLTPWLLKRLGRLPSRWREAHLLEALQAEANRLHEAEQHLAACRVEALARKLWEEADAREQAARQADLLTAWDRNHNGKLDAREQHLYDAALAHLRELANTEAATRKSWYLAYEAAVFGPTRSSELCTARVDLPLSICFDSESGSVRLADLLC